MRVSFCAGWRGLLLIAAICFAASLVWASAASAAGTYTVTTATDSNDGSCTTAKCSLRDAVAAANSSGGTSTIIVPAGLYKLSGELTIDGGTNVTIEGKGSASTVIDGQSSDRLFLVDQNGSLDLSGMTLRQGAAGSGDGNGGAVETDGSLTVGDPATGAPGDVVFEDDTVYNSSGGAIYAGADSTVAIVGAKFEDDTANDGGAIYDDSNNVLYLTDDVILDNGASGREAQAGAIDGTAGGGLIVTDSTFRSNSSLLGGAIAWFANTPVTITHTTFDANNGEAEGGAIFDVASSSMTLNYDDFLDNSGSLAPGGALYLDSSGGMYTLDHDLFDGNSNTADQFAPGYGGAIYLGNGSLDSEDSSFVGNQTANAGGALYAASGQSLTLVNDTFSHNGGPYVDGGAIDIATSTPASLVNDTITDNSGSAGGGGLYQASSYLETAGYNAPSGSSAPAGIENTVIADNTGGDCNMPFPSSFDLGYNMDSDGSCFSSSGTKVNTNDTPGMEPGLAEPADNGGPLAGNPRDGSAVVLPTDAESASSATVNAGTNTGCPSSDERGVVRPQGGACDIGAFELAAAALSVKKSAPASVRQGAAFQYTITLVNGGPGYSTGTILSDQLPAGERLWGVTASNGGTCSSTGSPAKVSCSLGVIASGSSVTVDVVVSESNVGTIINKATAANVQGSVASGSATTKVTAPATKAAVVHRPEAITGGATALTRTSARVHGRVKPGGARTTWFFQYRLKGRTSWSVSELHSTGRSVSVTAALSELRSGSVYQYRVVAVNSAGTSYGAVRTFRSKRQKKVAPRFTG